MNFHTFFPILSSSHFPIHLPLSRRLLWPPLKQVVLVRRFVLPANYYNQHYTVHIFYTFVAYYIRRVRFYCFKRRINARSIDSLLVTASSNHLKPNNPWKPNNWSRFPMFIPWTMATFTSSSLVTYLYAILPKQISHPCRRIKSPRPGNLRRERSQDECYTPETFQDQRVDEFRDGLTYANGQPGLDSHGFPMADSGYLEKANFSAAASKKERSVIEFYLDIPVCFTVCVIYVIYCDTTWNLFKSGRKNPLDTGDLLRVQLTRIHGRWETQRER